MDWTLFNATYWGALALWVIIRMVAVVYSGLNKSVPE